jgi:hypothetical protein
MSWCNLWHCIFIILICLGTVMPADACMKVFHPDPAPTITWIENGQGTGQATGSDIHETSDGGYIMIGTYGSTIPGRAGYAGPTKILVRKLDARHAVTWERTIGGSAKGEGRKIRQAQDGGYVFVGMTNSNDGDVQGLNHGGWDVVVGKLSSTSSIEWLRCYGGSGDDFGENIRKTSGGYTVIGRTFSHDGDAPGPSDNLPLPTPRETIAPVSAFAPARVFSWNITDDELLQFIMGDTLRENRTGYSDAWLFEVSPSGDLLWQQRYGGLLDDYGFDFLPMEDGGLLFAGATRSNIGHDPANHGESAGTLDGWLVKLQLDHTVEWQKCFGGSNNDGFFSIEPTEYTTTDGGCAYELPPVLVNKSGYILAGFTGSRDGSVIPRPNKGHESYDGWLLRLNADFSIKWTKCLGGSQFDAITSAAQTNKAKYVFSGITRSSEGDVARPVPEGTGPVPWVGLFYRCDNVLDWQMFPAGNQTGALRFVEITRDGDYLATGWTSLPGKCPGNPSDEIATGPLLVRLPSPISVSTPATVVSVGGQHPVPPDNLTVNTSQVGNASSVPATSLPVLAPCLAIACIALMAVLVRNRLL